MGNRAGAGHPQIGPVVTVSKRHSRLVDDSRGYRPMGEPPTAATMAYIEAFNG
jgi:hypothetical protein